MLKSDLYLNLGTLDYGTVTACLGLGGIDQPRTTLWEASKACNTNGQDSVQKHNNKINP